MLFNLILITSIFLLIINISYASPSSDRTDYYHNGTFYLTDGIEAGDLALDGIQATDGQTVTSHGWHYATDVATYEDTQKSLGSVSIYLNSAIGARPYQYLYNQTFTGIIRMKVRPVLGGGSTDQGNLWLDAWDGTNVWTGTRPSSSANWRYGTGGPGSDCDENVIAINYNNWIELAFNFTSGSNVKLYIDGVLCHTYGTTGINYFNMYWTTEGYAHIDEYFITNNQVPQSAAPDTTPPLLSNPICTSCTANVTADSTPTINVTCVDADNSCSMVRISNHSGYVFDNLTSSRNCTAGAGNTFVCTLISNDQFTEEDAVYPVYLWGLDNQGNNHSAFNLTINITYDAVSPYLYEWGTKNASSNWTFKVDMTTGETNVTGNFWAGLYKNIKSAVHSFFGTVDILGDLNQSWGNTTINNIYGEMWKRNTTGDSLNLATQNIYYNVSTANFTINGFISHQTGYGTLLSTEFSGLYSVDYHISLVGVSTHTYYCSIGIDGLSQENTENEMAMDGGREIISGTGFVKLTPANNVTLMLSDRSGTGSTTIYSSNVNLVRIGD